jgi:hypothetical protein
MARFFGGTIGPFSTIKFPFTVVASFTGRTDWGNTFALAHPGNPGAELVSNFHSKLLSPATGRFVYSVTISNISPVATFFFIDF